MRIRRRRRGDRSPGAVGRAPIAGDAGLHHLDVYLDAFAALNRSDIAALALTLGVLLFAVVTAIMLVRTRLRAAAADAAFRDEIMALKAERDRFNALLLSEPQILVSWAAADDEPDILGDTTLVTSASLPQRVLAFGSWLEPDKAQAMEHAVDALRADGEGFSHAADDARRPRHRGRRPRHRRPRGAAAARRQRAASASLPSSTRATRSCVGDIESLRTLIEALPSPVWARDVAGALTFVNAAYARAVEAKDAGRRGRARSRTARPRGARRGEPRARRRQDLSRRACRRSSPARGASSTCSTCRPAAAAPASASTRPKPRRCARELNRMTDAHRRTLDQLATGVAIFAADQRLTFYNAAYRALWELDAGFLDQSPTDSAVLDRLRAARKLPEQAGLPRLEDRSCTRPIARSRPREHVWHLPDGRTLRVVTTPNPEGGVTYLFDDVTERLDLERRYDALIRVQGETLDNLAEARRGVRQRRPAAAAQSGLRAACGGSTPLALDRAAAHRGRDRLVPAAATTTTRSGARCAAPSRRSRAREPVTSRLERRDGSVLDLHRPCRCPTAPRWSTFQDVTDTVNVERALRERNEALEAADALKIDFVHHVSYELRSPLTNIIGFAHLPRRRRRPGRSPTSSANISATSTPRPTRCSRSSTTSSISPPSTPAR